MSFNIVSRNKNGFLRLVEPPRHFVKGGNTSAHHYCRNLARCSPCESHLPQHQYKNFGVEMASKRVRTTITVREDNPVPSRRSKKKKTTSGVVILIVIAVLVFLAMNRNQHTVRHERPPVGTAR
jgi:hypothetical protein